MRATAHRNWLVLLVLVLVACKPRLPEGLALHGITAAFHFCPVDECDDMELGPSTRKLPYSGADIYDRWCVEVLFKRDGRSGQQAAVEIIQIEPTAESPFSWVAEEPIYNSDCSLFDQ